MSHYEDPIRTNIMYKYCSSNVHPLFIRSLLGEEGILHPSKLQGRGIYHCGVMVTDISFWEHVTSHHSPVYKHTPYGKSLESR